MQLPLIFIQTWEMFELLSSFWIQKYPAKAACFACQLCTEYLMNRKNKEKQHEIHVQKSPRNSFLRESASKCLKVVGQLAMLNG